MRPRKKRPDPARRAEILASARRDQTEREKGYREQALRLYPHVCAKCGRTFSRVNLRELTVHHKDGDHMNNPPDGSNWELLCLYCHDDEHGAYERARPGATEQEGGGESLGHNPFEGLRGLLDTGDSGPDAKP